jgi:hypothetical protein
MFAGLDAPVFHVRRRIFLVGPAAHGGGGEVDQCSHHQQRAGAQKPQQRRVVDDLARCRAAPREQDVTEVHGRRQQEQQDVFDDEPNHRWNNLSCRFFSMPAVAPQM